MPDANKTAGMSILTHKNNEDTENKPRVHIIDVGPAWMGLRDIEKYSKARSSETQTEQPKGIGS